MLSLLTHVCNSDTLKALVCVACAQVHTSIRIWHKPCVRHPEAWARAGIVRSGIQYWTVEKTLCQMLRRNVRAFAGTFQLGTFKERYASEGHLEGNPFQMHTGLDDSDWEWRRYFPAGGEGCHVLCCSEDVRITGRCNHDSTILCPACEIPLCSTCWRMCEKSEPGIIPMALGNDNYWGYTTEFIYRYEVRWIEMAIVMPLWTIPSLAIGYGCGSQTV